MEDPSILCAGLAILLAVAAGLYLLGRRPFSWIKRKEGQNTRLSLSAKRNIERITVTAQFDGEEISFERKRIRKGQTVDFVFPYSEKKVRIVVGEESGKAQELEV